MPIMPKWTIEELKRKNFIPVGERMPPTKSPVLVATPKYQCLATLEADGTWRATKTRSEVLNVIAWSPFPH